MTVEERFASLRRIDFDCHRLVRVTKDSGLHHRNGR